MGPSSRPFSFLHRVTFVKAETLLGNMIYVHYIKMSIDKKTIFIVWPDGHMDYSKREILSLKGVKLQQERRDRDRDSGRKEVYPIRAPDGNMYVEGLSIERLKRYTQIPIYLKAQKLRDFPPIYKLIPLSSPEYLQSRFKEEWLKEVTENPSVYDLKSSYIKAFASLCKEDFVLKDVIKVAFVVYPQGGLGDISLSMKLITLLKRLRFVEVTVFINEEYKDHAQRFFKECDIRYLSIPLRSDEDHRPADDKDSDFVAERKSKCEELKGYDLYFYLTLGQFYTIYLWLDVFKNENSGFFNVATVSEYNVNAQELIEMGHHTSSLESELGSRTLFDFYTQFSKMITFPLGIGELEIMDPEHSVIFRRPYDGLLITPLKRPPPAFTKAWPDCEDFGIPGVNFAFAMAYIHITSEGSANWKCLEAFVLYATRHYFQGKSDDVKPLHFIIPYPYGRESSVKMTLFDNLSRRMDKPFMFHPKELQPIYHRVRPSTAKVILNFKVLPLPFEEMNRTIFHSINDILVTGDQSVSDVLSCCPSKVIYYQTNSWKRNFASQLGKVLHLPHLIYHPERTSCVPLSETKEPSDISHLIDEWSFEKRCGLALKGLIQGAVLRRYYKPFRIALDEIAKQARICILNNIDTSDARLNIRNMINKLL